MTLLSGKVSNKLTTRISTSAVSRLRVSQSGIKEILSQNRGPGIGENRTQFRIRKSYPTLFSLVYWIFRKFKCTYTGITGNSTISLQEVIEGLEYNKFNPPHVYLKNQCLRNN